MADRYFTPDLDPLAKDYVLEGAELHHFRTVCRGKIGQTIELFDGRGQVAVAIVQEVERRSALLSIESREHEQPTAARLVIGSSIPKGDRGAFLVEKLTELGVSSLVPLRTIRSVTDPKEGKLARFERTVIEACKQSGRSFLMEIESSAHWTEFAERKDSPKWLLHPQGKPLRRDEPLPKLVAIGPEGGWTDEELSLASQKDWQLIRLPGHLLRVETAAITLAAISLLSVSS